MKVLFITNFPSPYRIDFFNELGKSCALTVLFEKHSSNERDSSWHNYNFTGFTGVFLKGVSINTDTAISTQVLKYVGDRSFDRVICSNFTSPTGMLAVYYMKRHGIPYYLESDGGFAKSGKGIKEKLKSKIIPGAKGYFSTGKEHDGYYIKYGATPNRIHRYSFSSLRSADILNSPVSQGKKLLLRDKLDMHEKQIVITIGQFIPRKGFDILMQCAARLPRDIGFYFIGGNPTEEYLSLQSSFSLDNVHFVGFKNKIELHDYYMSADLFVLPTREDIWGLVINEAMSNALPIITTNRCLAGLELVRDKKNGYIVPVEDIEATAEKISYILSNDTMRNAMAQNSLNIIKTYTIEEMARQHIDILSLT